MRGELRIIDHGDTMTSFQPNGPLHKYSVLSTAFTYINPKSLAPHVGTVACGVSFVFSET